MGADDFFDHAVKQAIQLGATTGTITFVQLNSILPRQLQSEQIERLFEILSENEIHVVDDEEPF